MSLKDVGNGEIKVTVNSNITSGVPVYLLVHARQKIAAMQEAEINNGIAHFVIRKDQFESGISHLTVFNNDKQPVCERLYFQLPRNELIIKEEKVEEQYATRQKISISINTTDKMGKPEGANMSMAIYRLDSLQTTEQGNILNYLYLTSDLTGTIESPDYYFSDTNAIIDSTVDNLMLTHGWRRFKWENIFKEDSSFKFIPEYGGHIIRGGVTNRATGEAISGILTYFSVPGKRVQFYYSKSNPAGIIQFYTKDFYDQNQIIIQTDSKSDSLYRIEIFDPY